MASYTEESNPYGFVEVTAAAATFPQISEEEDSAYAAPILSSSTLPTETESGSDYRSDSSHSLGSNSEDGSRSHERKMEHVGFRPSKVLALKKALKRPCPIDEASCSFWCRNFPSCQVAYLSKPSNTIPSSSTTATTTTSSSSTATPPHMCTSKQNFNHYANHETPKTETVIRALIREYQKKGCLFPLHPRTHLPDTRCIEALSCALDPTGSGQVYPEYFFAMAATFGPFDVLLNKLTHTIFYHPSNDCSPELLYFHGFASRSQCEEVLKEQCGGEELIPGFFVLRFSTRCPGQLSISWVDAKSKIKHTALLNKQHHGFQPIIGKSSSGSNGLITDGMFVKIGDLLKHHGTFFTTPCCVANTNAAMEYKTYDDIKHEVLSKHEDAAVSAKSPYGEVSVLHPLVANIDDDVYGEVSMDD